MFEVLTSPPYPKFKSSVLKLRAVAMSPVFTPGPWLHDIPPCVRLLQRISPHVFRLFR